MRNYNPKLETSNPIGEFSPPQINLVSATCVL